MICLNTEKIGIIGGDLRIIKLADILANDGHIIYTYALDKTNFLNINILKSKTIKDIEKNCEYIISGIPLSKDGVYLNTPFSDEKIEVDALLKEIEGRILVTGTVKQEIKEKAKRHSVKAIDLMEIEELAILNAIPTVEGAIQIAMEKTEITINNSNCLVLGFGRIGKLLTKSLNSLGADVSCMARKKSDLTWIEAYGYNSIYNKDLERNLRNNEYDIIFNTVPELILNSKLLEFIKEKETLIIELASLPGGIDLKKAEEYNIKVIKALGLPGKVAPLTSAKYIYKTLETILGGK